MDAPPTASPTLPGPPDAQAAALLEQLKDVAAPHAASWFPPAPGWWVVAALVILGVVLIVLMLRSRRQRNQFRREASELLDAIHARWKADADDRAYVIEMHQLVRRVAIHVAGRATIARRTGPDFVESLNALSNAAFSSRTGTMLTEASYRPATEIDVESIQGEVEAWLRELRGPDHA